jgi:hypothetical protein
VKQSEVKIGDRVATRVYGELVLVQVVRTHSKTIVSRGGVEKRYTRYIMKRVDNGATLPKAQPASALRPVSLEELQAFLREARRARRKALPPERI